MKKKILSMLLSMVLTVACFTGCGSNPSSGGETGGTDGTLPYPAGLLCGGITTPDGNGSGRTDYLFLSF